ncbi:MAG: squalene synthase HpnC [Ignavibacteriae bacterium]|nr:squalene synthase HpnC [Ignavibacteriota bacterium]
MTSHCLASPRVFPHIIHPMLTRDVHISRQSWSVDEAYGYCERLTRSHYENFPVASFFLPKDKRKHVAAIYAFARTADDYADEPGMTPAERIAAINDWEEQLLLSRTAPARHPVFVALSHTIERFEIPVELLRNLLHAFRSDVTIDRYETFNDVLQYCQYSANPVGRLVLLLFNYRSESLMRYSDSICTALQLANFWQDLSVDLLKNRVYLPQEDLRRFGYSEGELFAGAYTENFRRLMEFQVERTESLFRDGKPLLTEVGKDLSLELRLTWYGGMKILQKVVDAEYRVLNKRPVLTGLDKASVLASAFLKR